MSKAYDAWQTVGHRVAPNGVGELFGNKLLLRFIMWNAANSMQHVLHTDTVLVMDVNVICFARTPARVSDTVIIHDQNHTYIPVSITLFFRVLC